jgi:hypothetical protein
MLRLEEEDYSLLKETLTEDSKFLQSLGIYDYNLLLVVETSTPSNDEQFSKSMVLQELPNNMI